VGRINGQYGTLTCVPIHHLDRQLSFTELCALVGACCAPPAGVWMGVRPLNVCLVRWQRV
jgi:hypothetical protein